MGALLSTVQLDTHVLQWWSAEPERLSHGATELIRSAGELAVAGITWYELAWLAHNERILVTIPIGSWLRRLSAEIRTVGLTPAIAHGAATLPSGFPGDPADRIIYATAVEHGWPLVTKDRRLRAHQSPRQVAYW
ncbi:PIN domain-containing protein [Pseudonocardia sp.]|uniref:type II toxin-antitoxin system VapC family toxin n=1 Tax=Pseudonocardia sp. TaxID=60912 RepID=UPI00260D1512|nr:PIN domain-containing protein [Pseudonocardia sp.]